eukprot:CAMPEP_0174321666 /NCGR_PEP_ID=MMETSP0810-20121108/10478_1 /TAXON_ID=73025 ORGANISM="Eutreptiella gymnastica-like, Strain CCMP1594" /NCGR_SAMPLE_ID=MMETSP0810 /ASSEMBLY_ACC=CAM_ASM_000659 /LENGTH=64 /DNA_ID=CAMNT_0015433207 /DNA_START=68 /DNA_END=262 /DNA_ORIENTATION=+
MAAAIVTPMQRTASPQSRMRDLKRSGVDLPLCSSRACLHTAFIAKSFRYGGILMAGVLLGMGGS